MSKKIGTMVILASGAAVAIKMAWGSIKKVVGLEQKKVSTIPATDLEDDEVDED